jgi:sialic acid synthase SpsE
MVFVVAEIGINWDGDFEIAKKMIIESKKCGCDAVKFQAFPEELVKDHPERERLVRSSISKENIDRINDLAREANIEWFCTPMDASLVSLIEPYVKKIKIRYLDGKNLLENKSSKLIDTVLQTHKKIIISSDSSPKSSKYFGNKKIKWLYVVPKYPCSFDDLDFRKMNDFNGYSNHCPNILAPVVAVILGAKIIEVHVTSDKKKNFIDNPVSFDFIELKEMVSQIRNCEKIMR